MKNTGTPTPSPFFLTGAETVVSLSGGFTAMGVSRARPCVALRSSLTRENTLFFP